MADPKYANLPGIASDQPDVYETQDLLPEADQHQDEAPHQSDAVETLHLSATEAFTKFKGKHLDAKNVDFSDKIRGNNTNRKGYISWSGDLELCGPGENETPTQRYNRLNCEVKELQEQIDEQLTASKSGEKKDGNELASVAEKVKFLKDELDKMKLEEVLGSELIKSLDDPQNAAKSKLLSQLDMLKSHAAHKPKSKTTKEQNDDSSNVTYELRMRPENAKLEESEVLAKMESRIAAMEKAIGANGQSMASLSVETNQKSVIGAISVLLSRTSLLDPHHLDHVEGRLAALQAKMNAVAEKKAVIDDQEKQAKINELYDLVLQTESLGKVLPSVVDRLEALQGLHEQALQFSKALSQLDSVQQKLSSSLSDNESLLNETRKNLEQNVESITHNFTAIQQRIDNITK